MANAEFIRRVLFVVIIAALALFAWRVRDVFMLVFGGILFATLLDAIARPLCRYAGLPRGVGLVVAVSLLIVLGAGVLWLFGSQITQQFRELAQRLPENLEWLRQWLSARPWGQVLLRELASLDLPAAGNSVLAVVRGAFWSAAGALSNLLVILFAGLYFAAQPHLYTRGLLKLVPPRHRARAEEVLQATGRALRQWLLGQLVSMVMVGMVVAIGLSLLGVPSALALGLIAGLAEFVPMIGPIAAAIPAILVGLSGGFYQALYVLIFYVVVQQIESYAITPLVQREAVSLPPVVTLFAVLVFALIFGPLGLLFATPLAVAAMVFVNMLYVQDSLEQGAARAGRKD